MKNKKGLIILSSVIAVCAVGLVISPLVDWSVDTGSTSGNIGKSSRFSRKTADEGISNMEELIVSDPDYKNGIVTAYMVMHTRAQQFSNLVDMSNEVAGDIPEYAEVIDEMNKVYVTVNNVCASLIRAGENINATLNGEKRPDLAQNTINASLAYTTLQKQNKLANEFIKVTDEYVKSNEASDRLLFVRDQWVDYQLMTAALNKDTKATQKLENSGYLLSSDKAVSALSSFNEVDQVKILGIVVLEKYIGFNPDGLLSSSETFGELMGEFDRQGLLAATNKDGLVAATNKDGLIAATNKDGLIAVTNKDGLLAANNLDGLLSLVVLQFDGANLASAFGEATRTLQNFNPEGMASHDVSGSGLLHLDPSGYLGQTVNPTIASLAAGTGQAVTNFSGAGVQSGN